MTRPLVWLTFLLSCFALYYTTSYLAPFFSQKVAIMRCQESMQAEIKKIPQETLRTILCLYAHKEPGCTWESWAEFMNAANNWLKEKELFCMRAYGRTP